MHEGIYPRRKKQSSFTPTGITDILLLFFKFFSKSAESLYGRILSNGDDNYKERPIKRNGIFQFFLRESGSFLTSRLQRR